MWPSGPNIAAPECIRSSDGCHAHVFTAKRSEQGSDGYVRYVRYFPAALSATGFFGKRQAGQKKISKKSLRPFFYGFGVFLYMLSACGCVSVFCSGTNRQGRLDKAEDFGYNRAAGFLALRAGSANAGAEKSGRPDATRIAVSCKGALTPAADKRPVQDGRQSAAERAAMGDRTGRINR